MTVLLMIELIGTVAFAVSGAMVAIKKKLDLLGVLVLGVTTAVGGGLIRDIIIGRRPPVLFAKPVYVIAASVSVLVIFLLVKYRVLKAEIESERFDSVMNICDAVGLGIFTIAGIEAGLNSGFGSYSFLIVFLGVITGVGGGLLRDIMAGETPYILKKHVYACASIAGALCYVILYRVLNNGVNMIISAALVVIIRLLARHYEWNLPYAHK